eukprot:m.25448 g.25448  ORF g.25448 m.25448 type:complete len:636 (+) comp15007_c0_seq1:254-2161(+)
MSAIPEWKQALIRAKEAKKKEQERKSGGDVNTEEISQKFAHLPTWKRELAVKKWQAEQQRLKEETEKQNEVRKRRGSGNRHSLADRFEGEAQGQNSSVKPNVLADLGTGVASISDRLGALNKPSEVVQDDQPKLQRKLSRKSSFEKNGFTLVDLVPVEQDQSMIAETERREALVARRPAADAKSRRHSSSSTVTELQAVTLAREAERTRRLSNVEQDRHTEQSNREREREQEQNRRQQEAAQRRSQMEADSVAREREEEQKRQDQQAQEATAMRERKTLEANNIAQQQQREQEQKTKREQAEAKQAQLDRERKDQDAKANETKEAERRERDREATEAKQRREEQLRADKEAEEKRKAEDDVKAKETVARSKMRDAHSDLAQNHVEGQTPVKANEPYEFVPQDVPANETKEQEKKRKRVDRENRMKARASKRLVATKTNAAKYAEDEANAAQIAEQEAAKKAEAERKRKEVEAKRVAELREDEERVQKKRENARLAWEKQKADIELKEQQTSSQKAAAVKADADRRDKILNGGPTSTMSWPKGCLPDPAKLKLKRSIVWRDESSDDPVTTVMPIDFYSDDEYDEPTVNMSSKDNEDAGLSTPLHFTAKSKIATLEKSATTVDDGGDATSDVGNLLW